MKSILKHSKNSSYPIQFKWLAMAFFVWFALSSCATKNIVLEEFQVTYTKPLNKTVSQSSCQNFQSVDLVKQQTQEVKSVDLVVANQPNQLLGEVSSQAFTQKKKELPFTNSPPRFILFQQLKLMEC